MTGGSRAVIWWGRSASEKLSMAAAEKRGAFCPERGHAAVRSQEEDVHCGLHHTRHEAGYTCSRKESSFHLSLFLFSSKDAHPLFQRLYQFNWHDCVGSCRCRKYCKHVIAGLDLRSNKSAQIFQTWHLPHPGRAHCSGRGRCEFFRTGNQQLVPVATGSKEQGFIWGKSFHWYIKHQRKAPAPLPGAIPFKNDPALYVGLTCTRGTRSKTNSGHLNINQPAQCFAGGATARFSLRGSKARIWTGVGQRNSNKYGIATFDVM